MINSAVIALRFTRPKTERPFKIPFSIGRLPIIPVFGVIITVFMLIQFSLEILLIGLSFGIFAVLAYEVMQRISNS